MTNIVVTSTTNAVNVAFNDLSSAASIAKGAWRKESLRFVLNNDSSKVEVYVVGESVPFQVSYDGAAGTLQVDSVDGVAPTSTSDLYDKLVALLG